MCWSQQGATLGAGLSRPYLHKSKGVGLASGDGCSGGKLSCGQQHVLCE